MKMKKAIFWDNDGVLVDSEYYYFQATRDVLRKIGIPVAVSDFVRISLQQGESVLDEFGRALSKRRRDRLRKMRNELYTELIHRHVCLRPGILDCLRSLRGKARMGIVTSSLKEHFDAIHRRSRILPYFDFVLTRECFERSKPYPDPYLSALRLVKLPKKDCVVVEDSERGLASAKAAGLTCFVILSDLTKKGNFSSADGVFKKMAELKKALLEFVR